MQSIKIADEVSVTPQYASRVQIREAPFKVA
jgi:hypothetical protein